MSKQLLVLRHAKSEHGDPRLRDHDRPLNQRGREAAGRMGRFMADRGILPELVLCSSSRRTTETLELLEESSGLSAASASVEELYLASPTAMLEVVVQHARTESRVMLVGHNPGSEDVLHVMGLGMHEMPTCSLALIELEIDDWALLGESVGARLVDLWRVKHLPES